MDGAATELAGSPGAAQKLVSRGGLGNGWWVISVTPDPLCSGSQPRSKSRSHHLRRRLA